MLGIIGNQSHITDAPHELEVDGLCTSVVSYVSGMPVAERPELPGYNSAILSIVVCTMLLVVFSLHHYPRYFKSLTKNLWEVRSRGNVFDDSGMNGSRTLGVMSVQAVVYEALLILSVVITAGGSAYGHASLVMLTFIILLLTGAYYVWQILAYNLIGYVFADRSLTDQWMQGFYASQGLLGFLLLIPALLGLFYPASIKIVVLISILLYVAARIMFICKGFRIFYHNSFSLVYFILYLCSVEIIPIIAIYRGIVSICRISI
ncbi:MAG: DUF4271 domain-containing protein [Muribaculum sp.]|nr:DUF4271 domain-containing protein [Muribaculum sp.]